MDREGISETLVSYFAAIDDVIVAYMFGSVVRGDQLSTSDVDVGVLFSSAVEAHSRLFRRIQMIHALEDLLLRPVDVVDLHNTPPHVNHHLLRHKIIVKGQSERARIEFEKDVRRHYFDMLPYRQRYIEARLAALGEGGRSDGRSGSHSGALEAARRIHKRLGGRPEN